MCLNLSNVLYLNFFGISQSNNFMIRGKFLDCIVEILLWTSYVVAVIGMWCSIRLLLSAFTFLVLDIVAFYMLNLAVWYICLSVESRFTVVFFSTMTILMSDLIYSYDYSLHTVYTTFISFCACRVIVLLVIWISSLVNKRG